MDKRDFYITPEELPDVPSKYSDNDIEVIIHSHPTNLIKLRNSKDNIKWYGGNASKPSETDKENKRWKSHTNIIVGPLKEFKTRTDPDTGNDVEPKKEDNGIVIYKNGEIDNHILTIKAVRNILKSK